LWSGHLSLAKISDGIYPPNLYRDGRDGERTRDNCPEFHTFADEIAQNAEFAVHETEPVPVHARDEQFDVGMRRKEEVPLSALECSFESSNENMK